MEAARGRVMHALPLRLQMQVAMANPGQMRGAKLVRPSNNSEPRVRESDEASAVRPDV